MKSAPFVLHQPTSLPEVFEIMGSIDDLDDVKILAGGQSLMPMLALRLAQPLHVIDINGLGAQFEAVQETGQGIRIGTLARQRDVERSPVVAARCQLLSEAIPFIAHPAIRNRGTVGGSLTHADPAAELPAVALALNAQMIVAGPGGDRSIPAADFFAGFLTTALEPDEVLTHVDFADLPSRSGAAFVEVSRRHGDFALVAAAATMTTDGDNIVQAQVALAGVSGTAVRATKLEDSLVGQRATAESIRALAPLAATGLLPPDDVHATGAYRQHVAAVLTARALVKALQRIPSGGSDASH